MISLMTPSRGRPEQLKRMAHSARETASGRVEIVVWLDADDPSLTENIRVCREEEILYLLGPRNIIHSARWDKCLTLATSDILAHANDDIIFRTPGWDGMVEEFFEASVDKLWVVGGDDGYLHSQELAPHPIVHRRWLHTLGYIIPPYFDGEYGDMWVSDLANRIERKAFLPFLCEHMHFTRTDKLTCPKCGRNDANASVPDGTFCNGCGHLWGETRMDETARNYLARSQAQNPAKIYEDREVERIRDAQKLKDLLGTPCHLNSKY